MNLHEHIELFKGTVKIERKYKTNEFKHIHGLELIYFKNGNVKTKTDWDMGNWHGERIWYDLDGNVRYHDIYVNNKHYKPYDKLNEWDYKYLKEKGIEL